jgi:hypothetical protein
MLIYHVINSDVVNSILKKGLKRSTRGEKGDDDSIKKTDAFLDNMRPKNIKKMGLSRVNAIYGYLPIHDGVADIRSGKVIATEKIVDSGTTLLRLTVDPKRCYISDLDMYDMVKDQIRNEDDMRLKQSAAEYWTNVTRLDKHSIDIPRRPEIMVTYDISPGDIEVLN